MIAITFGTINIIGGFFVTDRMLDMFKRKDPPKADEAEASAEGERSSGAGGAASTSEPGSGGPPEEARS